jgi:hypothetical protein
MTWLRTLLAVAFLLSMQFGSTISLAVPGAHSSGGLAMAMLILKDVGPSSVHCPSCKQASDAMLGCIQLAASPSCRLPQ